MPQHLMPEYSEAEMRHAGLASGAIEWEKNGGSYPDHVRCTTCQYFRKDDARSMPPSILIGECGLKGGMASFATRCMSWEPDS